MNVYGPVGELQFTLTPFGADFAGGVRVATDDFNRDCTTDIVVGTGPVWATRVIVFDANTKEQLFAMDPFEASFTGGVHVAAAT